MKGLDEKLARAARISEALSAFVGSAGAQEPSFGAIVRSLVAHNIRYCKENDIPDVPVNVIAPLAAPAPKSALVNPTPPPSVPRGAFSSRKRTRAEQGVRGNSPSKRRGGGRNKVPAKPKGPRAAKGAMDLLGKLEKKLPKKYQLNKQFRNKLGLALQAVTESGEGGIALSDVKKFVDATVMQSNEYLGVLSRLDLVFKKKDKVGAKYFRSRYRKTK